MTEFIIIRHGETAWNADGRIQGHTDVPLTDKGLEQARLVAERLRDERIDAVYASDLQRATVTGQAIAEGRGLEVITTTLLREAYLGEWQGMTLAEVEDKFPAEFANYRRDSINNRPPGAERLESVISRCRQFLDEVTAERPNERVAVGAHGGSVRGLVAVALGLGPELYRRLRLDNGGITIIETKDGRPVLKLLNDTCHLTAVAEIADADQGVKQV